MITTLSLTNFKSWRKIDKMRMSPLTGFFGSNSSGKTSILQFLLLMKQTVDSADRHQALNIGDKRSIIPLGTFRDIVHKHDTHSALTWSLKWTPHTPLTVKDTTKDAKTLLTSKHLVHEAEIVANPRSEIVVKRFSYSLDGDQRFSLSADPDRPEEYLLKATDFTLSRKRGRPWPLPGPVKCYGFPDQVNAYYQNAGFLNDLALEFESLFANVYYLGPLREYPHREYRWAGSRPADMGPRGENVIDAILASRNRNEKISRKRGKNRFTVEEYVAYWLKELNLIHQFSVGPVAEGSDLFQVRVQKSSGAAEVLITDVGFGVSQILPVLVLCYYAPEGSTIILEQPEIHLHPSVQAGLADVFIDASQVRNVQIIVESHSEHLLRRLQRRIAEKSVAVDDVSLYFCEVFRGDSRLTPLELDLFGIIQNWPKDFFGDPFGETAAMTKAAMERKRSGA